MEIVVRATVIFFFLWLITRVVGRSTLGELSTFELLLFVTMGDLVQQSVTQQDYSVTSGVLAVSTFALLTVGLSYAKWRWPRTRPVIHGVPVVVVSEGEPMLDAMRAERLTLDDLMAAARKQGIERFSDMRLAVLEADGGISFFQRSGGRSGAPETTPVGSE
ncbi:MAG TPA: YetF domain-containing protein [Mycobacteriales bacterium]|nr:YetF domain-containing protein [Mycobacteriales bacterium]